ncbi:hypothetical protein QVD17_38583 [Tagetes erecta]|uniref:Wax synthase domain-containing protein n=1 Tax=Tagetes erecta TaxID=13708 RepID=A0AAD8JNF6_TARER|nr:hypothetical protein QVD17_38583 [Tagetes erecta]
MEAIAKSFIIYTSTTTASLTYCYYISSNIPKGIYRFISLIPIIFLFTILPLHCTFIFTTAITASFTTWLTNFKLIRFAFDLDHSPYHPSHSLIKFITLASLPIKWKPIHSTSIHSPIRGGVTATPPSAQSAVYSKHKRPFGLLLKWPFGSNFQTFFQTTIWDWCGWRTPGLKLGFQALIFSVLVNIVQNYKHDFHNIHPNLLLVIYCGLLFLIIDIAAATINAMLFIVTGLELEPSSNQPYLATSLQNFWGRWNLMVTNTLRHTVYKPVRSVLSGYKWAPLAGVIASFIVSGLMHELFVYQLSREKPTWEMTWFFVIHGMCVVVEMIVKRCLDGGCLRLPVIVTRLLTMVFVAVTGMWLFFPPLIKRRVDVKILEEYTFLPSLHSLDSPLLYSPVPFENAAVSAPEVCL